MKRISPLICLILGLLSLNLSAAPAFVYYFEDNSDPTQPTNSGGATPFNLLYRGETRQTTDQAKFGHGSMEIKENAERRKGFYTLPVDSVGDIHKLTLALWVRPSTTKGFMLMLKLVPNGHAPNSLSFGYIRDGYDCLNFNFYDGKVNNPFMSNKVRCLISGEWIHLAATFDEGKVAFYVNGLPYGGGTAADPKSTVITSEPGQSIWISLYNLSDGSYVDDYALFLDRALSEEDVDGLYHNGLKAYLTKTSAP
ncbi:MAG: LamG-like jellyroll fold domain-containing protein [Chthoniobacterales bacterium]